MENATIYCEPSRFYTQTLFCVICTALLICFLVYFVRLLLGLWKTPLLLLQTVGREFLPPPSVPDDFLFINLKALIYNFVFNKFYGFFCLCLVAFLCLDLHCDSEREFYLKCLFPNLL